MRNVSRVERGGWTLFFGLLFTQFAAGQEFRVESEVFRNAEAEPVAANLTLFTGGLAYDFLLTGAEEVLVCDLERGRFVLLDVPRRMKTTLAAQQVLDLTAQLKAQGVQGNAAALFEPAFDKSFDADTGWITLAGKPLMYRAKGQAPPQPELVARYREFADWYARLNALRAGNLPPFARFELNQELATRGWIPVEVERTQLSEKPLGRKVVTRSQHISNWRFSQTDRQRIERAGGYLASFREVSLAEYCRPATAKSAKASGG